MMRYIMANRDDIIISQKVKVQESFGTKGMVVEIEDDDFVKLKYDLTSLEPDYNMILGKVDIKELEELAQQTIILATIGERIESKQISYYYEMRTRSWEETAWCCKLPALWICCYSQQNEMRASDYLKCIDNLHELAKGLKNPLIILGHVTSKLPYFSKGSLTEQLINCYLEEYNSLYLLWETDNRKKGKVYYTNASCRKLKKVMLKWLGCSEANLEEDKSGESCQTLYQDNFYNQISQNEMIYIPLNPLDEKDCTYYHKLHLKTVYLGKNGTFLYDERKRIDALSYELKGSVPSHFYMPILTASPIQTQVIEENKPYKVIQSKLPYRGTHVYIGVISSEGVDYTQDCLRTSTGTTRIAGFWKQNRGSDGIYYTAQQINEALQLERPEEKISFNPSETYVATLLGLAGGKTEAYEAIATEAEFLVAQINTAPKALQRIYGGEVNASAVLMPDLLIAAYQLMEVAKKNNRSLVLMLPYQTNISPHDGSTIYEQMLSLLGTRQNCTFIVPTGEEADKKHHQVIARGGTLNPKSYLQVSQKVTSLIGMIYMRQTLQEFMILHTPDSSENPIRLDEEGITHTRYGTIYSTGVQDDYNNGTRSILFRVEKMQKGRWQLEYILSRVRTNASIDLWITQREMNPYVTLEQASSSMTLGANSAVNYVINVGSYDPKSLVVLGSSGRGEIDGGGAKPLCVTQGISILPFDYRTLWKQVEGTAVAMSLLAGVVATIYNKWQVELGAPYANTLIMRNMILSHMTQLTGVSYPNPSQGYGIFDLESLPKLINILWGDRGD